KDYSKKMDVNYLYSNVFVFLLMSKNKKAENSVKIYATLVISTIKNSIFCRNCAHSFVNKSAKYCPICGNNKLINKKEKTELIYSGYQLDKNGRAIICPKCENEQVNHEGDICKICSTYLINKCAETYQTDDTGWNFVQESCESILDGNARYCSKCGNESTFYRQGLLQDWIEEKQNYENNSNPFPFTVNYNNS
ncbi:hypothetical protein P8791_21855, partial [Bacillus subtilis]|nr:hypothetical protein [Bacillus subtilis]